VAKQRMRQSRQERDDIAAMLAKRDQLDRDQQQQRQREEAAFARYAHAQLRVTEIERERADAIADLDLRREQVMTDAREQLDAVTADQCAVLVELHVDGRGRRSAEDLAALFELPVKRVRAMLKRARAAEPAGRDSATPAPEVPARAGGEPGGAATPAPAKDAAPAIDSEHGMERPPAPSIPGPAVQSVGD
jgi:hypothetical protein